MQKKILHTSNLALRFYKKDGWTLAELISLRENDGELIGWSGRD